MDSATRSVRWNIVAIRFFVLAPYVGHESLQALIERERPDVSWLRIALSASSMVVMPCLGIAKQRIADQIGSAATKGEGCACASDPSAGLRDDDCCEK